MKEYWVNVYAGIPAYCCSKHPSRDLSIRAMQYTDYDYPLYRIHVKMKPVIHVDGHPRYWMDRYLIGGTDAIQS